jgi:hypothetical protein
MNLRQLSSYILLTSSFLIASHQGWADASYGARVSKRAPHAEIPWLTGPLLTPTSHVIPKGHYNVEPYEYVTVNTGVYDAKWNAHSTPNFYILQTQVPFQYGFVKRFDFQITPQFYWKHTDGASHWDFGDMGFAIDYQLLANKTGKWWPAIRLTAGVNIPFGRYQKLDPSSKGTDIGGIGSWQPTISMVFGRLFTFKWPHVLSTRLYLAYNPTAPVHVKGLNAYGGAKGTHGKVYPGNSFTGLLGLEYTLAQKWALALDVDYVYTNKTRFRGHATAPVGSPSSVQLSLAPALEYNWNVYVGLIAGCWFTVAGRNSTQFTSGVIALNIYH